MDCLEVCKAQAIYVYQTYNGRILEHLFQHPAVADIWLTQLLLYHFHHSVQVLTWCHHQLTQELQQVFPLHLILPRLDC